jgi:hypothetical protein
MIISFILEVLTLFVKTVLTIFSLRWLDLAGISIFSGETLSTVFDWVFGLITFFNGMIDFSSLFFVITFVIAIFSAYFSFVFLFFVLGILKAFKFW